MDDFLKKIIHDTAAVSFITYVVYLGLELIFEGLISNYFDLNLLLIVVIVFGSISWFVTNRHDVV